MQLLFVMGMTGGLLFVLLVMDIFIRCSIYYFMSWLRERKARRIAR